MAESELSESNTIGMSPVSQCTPILLRGASIPGDREIRVCKDRKRLLISYLQNCNNGGRPRKYPSLNQYCHCDGEKLGSITHQGSSNV
jgi:hypothetical protein